MKFGVFAAKRGHYVCQILERPDQIGNDYILRSMAERYGDSIFPIWVNKLGAWGTVSEENQPVRYIESDVWPELPLEEAWNLNTETFTVGWVSPGFETYSCEYGEHLFCAQDICRRFNIFGNDPENDLLRSGWLKVVPRRMAVGQLTDSHKNWCGENGIKLFPG